ncbi:TIGR01548 family HAD-type hydrolase [Planktothrix sp. FACHB-1365]|uniref:TIGR01548 family HAD-type hydrolase n=1 Tax=Planktothrix sp. FACHB-1365 TaxID=2692855 RepID=UPI0016875CB5|nr:TIGR01548 family HAD-type hydrolase [Planktothrix sp. FACHB-1365]MBD2484252.1 TIGR01548 family HAD-type hydrolase [Planktothrix sp. FACHB-1365]
MKTAIVVFDIDGVIRDVGGSYRRAIADTVEQFTNGAYRPTLTDIDALKSEGIWNNDWEASQELVYRYFEAQGKTRTDISLNYKQLIDFFQSRYRGLDPEQWTGYICSEPLLCTPNYFQNLTENQMLWGFFSGAMRDEALYVLQGKLNLGSLVLRAMEDVPGKPDPTGLFEVIAELESEENEQTPVLYVGDTVADLYTVTQAKQLQPDRIWVGVGVLPPHIQQADLERRQAYQQNLEKAGATIVLNKLEELTPDKIKELIA